MTRIAISGANGRMGRVIAALAKERADCEIVSGIDKITEKYNEFPIVGNVFDLPEKPDVIIDFSHPSTLDDLLSYCKMNSVPLVIATTGYTDEERSKITAAASQTPIFFTFNMSLGINLLAELARKAAQILGSQFDVEIVEKHHNQKLDAPSGTALALADAINGQLNDEYDYNFDRSQVREKRKQKEIGISAVRGGTIVGEHEIIFAGTDEVLEFKHTAYSKAIFGKGAVQAAKFLKGKAAGMYGMKDVI